MSNLNIVEVVIEDSLNQIAKTCTLTLAPSSLENPPVAEFGYPGDTMQQSGTAIRPNGSFIDIVGAYGGMPSQILFRGSIEYMDDMEDADQYSYKIVLSQVPRGFPHRQKKSAVWNMTSHAEDIGWESVTAHSILATICSKAGIILGRCDLPNYNIWGTYEVVQQSPIEVAEALIAPFNQCDHEKYYVRMDMNGLQIIKVNYTKGANTTTGVSAYALSNILKKQSSYQLYIPSKSIDGDILLSGGDKYGTNLSGVGVWQVTAVHTYIEDSRSAEINQQNGTYVEHSGTYTEKTTEVAFDVELSYNAEDIAYDASISFPAVPQSGQDIDNIIDQVKRGDFTSVTILNSLAWHTIERFYTVVGLERIIETFVRYEVKNFSGDGTVDSSFMNTERTVPTFDETVTYGIGNNGTIVALTMVRHWFTYDSLGNTIKTTIANYNNYRGWHLAKVEIQSGETAGVTNSQIQFYLNAWNSHNNPPEQQPLKNGTRISSNKTPLLRYQLLNGQKLYPLTIPKRHGNSSFIISEDYWTSLVATRSAIQINCSGMDYEGLYLVWGQMLESLKYQTGGNYWHQIDCHHILDTSPVVGESICIGGVTAICETIKHTITLDEAVTQASAKRLATI